MRRQVMLMALLAGMLAACGGAIRDGSSSTARMTPTVQVRSSDGMPMVCVPGGTFSLAEAGGLSGRHDVTLSAYWIDQTEITNAHYELCVEDGTCQPASNCVWGEPTYGDEAYADHPVICVTWRMAQTYCAWAGGRLPTEAEWDYAARGPQRSLYAWGDEFDGTLLNTCDVNCPHVDQRDASFDDGYAMTAPAGSYPGGASWCGALDMNGNVWEWVGDWYAPYTSGAVTDPTGPLSGEERVMRGGSWYDDVDFSRADHRHPYEPASSIYIIGFRCVIPTEDSGL